MGTGTRRVDASRIDTNAVAGSTVVVMSGVTFEMDVVAIKVRVRGLAVGI